MNIFFIIFFILGCFVFSYLERHFRIKFAKWIFIIPFCILAANRSISVPDTEAYTSFFDSLDTSLSISGVYGFEIGFEYLSKIIKLLLGNSSIIFMGTISMINLLIIDYSMKKINKSLYSEQKDNGKDLSGNNRFFQDHNLSIIPLTLYVAFFGLYFNTIVLRVGIALSLIVLASTFSIKPQKVLKDYFLICGLLLLAYFFHATAIFGIFIMFIFLFTKTYKSQTYIWIMFISGVIYMLNLSSSLGDKVFNTVLSLNNLTTLSDKLNNYSGDITYNTGVAMKYVFFWVMGLFLIRFNSSISSKIFARYLNVYVAGIIIYSLFRSVLLLERVTDFFLAFSFILFYVFLLYQKSFKFWFFYVLIIVTQLIFILRITTIEMF